MPSVATKPDGVRPYLFHGITLEWRDGEDEAVGDCPWCGRQGKFYVKTSTGQYRCWVCAEGNDKGGGNPTIFLRRLHKASAESTTDHATLANDRRLLDGETLRTWGVVRSITTGDWLVPGYTATGALCQLYRYVQIPERMALLPTPGKIGHHLHGVNLYSRSKREVYLCEGPWDGMALWEMLARVKRNGVGLALTASPDSAILSTANVLAVPGCNVFFESWLPLFAGKDVFLLYDNDLPRKHPKTGREIRPGGLDAMKRVAAMLLKARKPPLSVSYLKWGEVGYDPTLPTGFDVRDALSRSTIMSQRVFYLAELLAKLTAIPDDWTTKSKGKTVKNQETENEKRMELLPCEDYRTLTQSWRKALKWTDGLDHALSMMLAVAASTKSVGDQLWVKVIGPPSSGKSTLCEAVSTARDYVLPISVFRGFHSGYRGEGSDGEKDHSLINDLRDMTLAMKDGDTLLQSPNLPQILAEARDLYDGTSRSRYRNAQGDSYGGLRTTWILCGTEALRALDSSELGERFVDCVMMGNIEDELEDAVTLRVARRAARDVSIESNGKAETQVAPELAEAYRLTGGYVEHLRRNGIDILSTIDFPEAALVDCAALAKFTAHMRARPSSRQRETAEREFAARLTSQFVRLAKCLALVLNRSSVDADIVRRVRRVALDTSRGLTLAIVAHLYDRPLTTNGLKSKMGESEGHLLSLLRFLRRIKVVDYVARKSATGVQQEARWEVTERMQRIYARVMGIDDAESSDKA